MKKRDLRKLALMGLSSGILMTQGIMAEEKGSKPASSATQEQKNKNEENMNYHLMTEDELILELNEDGIRMYKSLSPEGKALAREVASMKCNNTNPCKALNACATDKNKCAGQGSCQTKGKCAVSDKNLAVKLVYDKMADKRTKANQANTVNSKR